MTSIPALVPSLIALQFLAFGWRINREITVGDESRRTWFPAPDWLNIFWLLLVVGNCVVLPIATGRFGRVEQTTLAMGYTLIAFHPINMAAHYRLFSRDGRSVYLKDPDGDYPFTTGQEVLSLLVSVAFAALAGCLVWNHSN